MADSFTEEELVLPMCKYKCVDNAGDVQLHAWGDSLQEAFEQCGVALFSCMTELSSVEIKLSNEIEAFGHDLDCLLYHFLDELFFLFSCEPFFICSKLKISEFKTEGEEYKIRCTCYGELGRPSQGTELKTVTYPAMQIVNEPDKGKFELFVTIDI